MYRKIFFVMIQLLVFLIGVNGNNEVKGWVWDNCPPGQYADWWLGCENCPAGTYGIGGYNNGCFECDVGTYNPHEGQGACFTCNPGTYTNSKGSISCSFCPDNYYAENYGSTSCKQCDLSCRIFALGYSSCSYKTGVCYSCYYGHYIDGKKCSSCPKGTYSNGYYLTQCKTCSDYTYQDEIGQSSCYYCDSNCYLPCDKTTGHCSQCKPGYEINSYNQKLCLICSEGKYSDQTQNGKCMNCPLGTANNQKGQTECIPCQQKTYANLTSQTICKMCPETCVDFECGVRTGKCNHCIGGYEKNSNGDCQPCQKGYYSQNGADNCTLCPAGSISTKEKSTSCIQCNALTYSNKERTKCMHCLENCITCDLTNGHCSKCQQGFGLVTNGETNNCTICTAGYYSNGITECVQCSQGYYSEGGKAYCMKCDEKCKTCNPENGKCTSCFAGYEFNETTGMCIPCQDTFYSLGGTMKCEKCNCPITCNPETSDCTTCQSGNKMPIDGDHCISCSINGNCIQCDDINEENSKICVKCEVGYYLNENNCNNCSYIPNCIICNQMDYSCSRCDEHFISTPQNETKCLRCKEDEIKFSDTECMKCSTYIPHCSICEMKSTSFIDGYKCVECYAPYSVNSKTGNCEECIYGYDENKKECIQIADDCWYHLNSTHCIKPREGYILQNGECYQLDSDCLRSSMTSCEVCSNRNVLSHRNECSNEIPHCKYSENDKCLLCEEFNTSSDGQCSLTQHSQCEYFKDDICYRTVDGYYQSTNLNSLKKCDNSEVCIELDKEQYSIKCKEDYYLPKSSIQCKEINTKIGCKSTEEGYCLECVGNQHLKDGECIENSKNCEIQNGDICLQCTNETVLVFGECISIKDICCDGNLINDSCTNCKIDYFKMQTKCLERIGSKYEQCLFINHEFDGCNECQEGYYLDKQHQCNLTIKVQSNRIKLNENENINEETELSNCLFPSEKGCLRCKDGYYLEGNECLKCHYSCGKCINYSTCIGCEEYMYLDKIECKDINTAYKGCSTIMASNNGCANCKDGYYKNEGGKQCEPCDTSCETCLNGNQCIQCTSEYWRKIDENGLCNSFETLLNCLNKTSSGCIECENGYYLYDSECFQCHQNCTSCINENECKTCIEDYIFVNELCIQRSEIANCLQANDSICIKCVEGYELNSHKNGCVAIEKKMVMIISLSVVGGFVVIVIIILIIVVFCLVIYFQRKKEKEKMKNIALFQLTKTNIVMIELERNIFSNKKQIDFGSDMEEIPVDRETKDLICIANRSYDNLKVQFTMKNGCDKYEIRTNPQIITIKKGYVCEFEVFIKPLCSCKLEDEIYLVALDLKKGEQMTIPLKLIINTVISTKLHPEELKETKKLGEGSFGIVFLGTFRGNKVAIKKIKDIIDEEKQMKEFEKEVAMLDKFRNEYIIHFYGAVFIPGKICMVTEFAPYGSIQDIMKKQPHNPPSKKLRLKFMVDGAKGMKYLHDNGIIHRDIKPDNFLVISLENDLAINAKLTDFGSTRNINQLMTNMTFTKGIGSPIYMAPEVLNKQYYKMPADIYSFAISFCEVFSWKECYPKEEFKFPWKIAEFVVEEKRQPIKDGITQQEYRLIQNCWCSNPSQRLQSNQIIEQLEKLIK